MIDRTERNPDLRSQMILANTGYASKAEIKKPAERDQPACVALSREEKRPCVVPIHKPAAIRMGQWLNTPAGRARYRRRKTIPEPVFGWIKQVSEPSACGACPCER